MKSNKNTIGVEAVNKALEILNCFTEKNEALTVTKIAQITGEHKSRISRISKSLENFGYIRKIKSGEIKITIKNFFVNNWPKFSRSKWIAFNMYSIFGCWLVYTKYV